MDPATWIALGALAVSAVGPTVTTVRQGAKREGKLDGAIEQLTRITSDHEARLRKGRL